MSTSSSISSDEFKSEKQNLEGDVISNFAFIKLLGRGSNANVWLCFDINADNFVAIKVQNPEDYKSGLDEIKILSKIKKLNCEYLSGYKSHFENKINDKKTIFIIFELMGLNLNEISGLSFSNNFINKVINQCVTGINVLHKNNITHCDIKPENILLTKLPKLLTKVINTYKTFNFLSLYKTELDKHTIVTNEVKNKIKKMINRSIVDEMKILIYEECQDEYDLEIIEQCDICITDFGLFCQNDEYHLNSFGTLYYLAPESLLYLKHTPKIDFWAFGCTIYELITGNILFDPPKDEYDRKYHHFYKMQRLFGKLPYYMINKSRIRKKYFNNNGSIKEYDKSDSENISEYLIEKGFNKYYIPFLLETLQLDPKKRKLNMVIEN